MPTRTDADRLVQLGDIDGLMELSDEFSDSGDFEGQHYCLEKLTGMAGAQTDPQMLDKCLSAMRIWGMRLSIISEGRDTPATRLANPRKAFDLFKQLLRDYPNERQATFVRCLLGAMYYDERYIAYGVPNCPDKGMRLFHQWEEECSKIQALSTMPVLCTTLGMAIFMGATSKTRPNFLPVYSEELTYARSILQNIQPDVGTTLYQHAQNLLQAIESALEKTLQIQRIVGSWEWQAMGHFLRFDFGGDGRYRYRSSKGADVTAGYYLTETGNQIHLGAAGQMFLYEVISDQTINLYLNPQNLSDVTTFRRV